jgi:hypothetical protein
VTDFYETRFPTHEEEWGFILGMAEQYGISTGNPPSDLSIVVIWATRLKEAWRSADERPENPYADAEIEYSEDMLESAVRDWLETVDKQRASR